MLYLKQELLNQSSVPWKLAVHFNKRKAPIDKISHAQSHVSHLLAYLL